MTILKRYEDAETSSSMESRNLVKYLHVYDLILEYLKILNTDLFIIKIIDKRD